MGAARRHGPAYIRRHHQQRARDPAALPRAGPPPTPPPLAVAAAPDQPHGRDRPPGAVLRRRRQAAERPRAVRGRAGRAAAGARRRRPPRPPQRRLRRPRPRLLRAAGDHSPARFAPIRVYGTGGARSRRGGLCVRLVVIRAPPPALRGQISRTGTTSKQAAAYGWALDWDLADLCARVVFRSYLWPLAVLVGSMYWIRELSVSASC